MPAVALACFFLSGASGLILELLWTRMLTLVFGSTTLAVSTVLTAFLGGFVFLPIVGVRTTNVIAATFDLGLAGAIVLARRLTARRSAGTSAASLDQLLADAQARGEVRETEGRPLEVTPRARRAVLA